MTDVFAPWTEETHQGIVLRWHCSVGDRVRKGQVLGEIETDKANIEIEAPEDGVVEEMPVPAGATVERETMLVRLGDGTNIREGRPRPVSDAGREDDLRCSFCRALRVPDRIDCARCGAPL